MGDISIKKALLKKFDQHRIVFWYDTKNELRADFESLEIPDVEKIEIKNNEFGVKYRILREEPKQKFLLYRDGPTLDDIDNWLLDIQLAYGEFRTDQVAIWLNDLGLEIGFANVIDEHIDFFGSEKRREALKSLLDPKKDSENLMRLKMIAVCTGSDARIDNILENLLMEHAHERDEKVRLIERSNLNACLWKLTLDIYGYRSDTQGIKDFAITLFKSCYAMGTDGEISLTNDALVFLKRWKDSQKHGESFGMLSNEIAEILKIQDDLESRDYQDLLDLDYFRLIDQKIVSDLINNVAERTISQGECSRVVRKRREMHWYKDFRDLYEAVEYGSQLIHAINETVLVAETITDSINLYTKTWYKLDYLYRKYIYHSGRHGQVTLLSRLSEQIENLYVNNFLLKVNDNFQSLIDKATEWDAPDVLLQRNFYQKKVKSLLDEKFKATVIISDALRYEVGEELARRIRSEDKYDATVTSMLSMLPSYTQLGMASLLPNNEISINEAGNVNVDGMNSMGLDYRKKILNKLCPKPSTTLSSTDFLSMDRDTSRELTKGHDVIYIYHDRIDATGDDKKTEGRVFEAVEETLIELIKIVKKLYGANATNIYITSDHGFIYQNRPIDESDFIDTGIDHEVLVHNRRFVLGKNLPENPSFRKFTPSELHLEGDIEVMIPKSINRMRQKGSGSRFVHGGASLQEVVLPVIHIKKRRQSDISTVEIDILKGASSVITSGQITVAFYQAQPVSDKVRSRTLRAGIFTQSGDLISDSHELVFDIESENPREREIKRQFILTRESDQVNAQEIILKLEELEPGTSYYKEYRSMRYTLRRSFTSDFDF